MAALREAGIPVSLAESLDAEHAVLAVGLGDRRGVRAAYAACVVKRVAHRRTFDRLFELWWPAAVGDGAGDGRLGDPDLDGDHAENQPDPVDPEQLEVVRDAVRSALRDVLLAGDPDAIDRLARHAVSALGRDATAQGGRQSWFTYRVLRALSPATLMASMLDALLAGTDRGGLAEKIARQTLTERIQAFSDAVETEVRRRSAEERGAEAVGRTSVTPLVDQVDFLRASRDQIAELRREVGPVARRLATRLTAKRRHGRSGRLDVRRTVRSSMSTGGVPLDPRMKPRHPHKPELVVMCDVSGSVASFAHFTVLLAFALREQFARVRVFAFVDTMDEVTRFFDSAVDPVEALARMSSDADLVWFDGHSDYGHAFEVFESRWPDAVGPKTSLLVLGDARTNYRGPGLEALRGAVRRSRHAYWLNPEPRQYWTSGDSLAATYGELLPMVECRNVTQLQEFVSTVLAI